jgi:hypothetical protein
MGGMTLWTGPAAVAEIKRCVIKWCVPLCLALVGMIVVWAPILIMAALLLANFER